MSLNGCIDKILLNCRFGNLVQIPEQKKSFPNDNDRRITFLTSIYKVHTCYEIQKTKCNAQVADRASIKATINLSDKEKYNDMCKSGSVDKLGWLQNRVLLEE